MGRDVLTRRALNRATLARQLLLRRAELDVSAAVEHLVGLQAQEPLDPYTGLWSRLAGFRPGALSDRLIGRRVVRIVAMRGTIHLLTAPDALRLRPLMQPVLDAEIARHRDFAPALEGVDLEAVLAFARSILAERPHPLPEFRAALAARFPTDDSAALAYACRCRLALVQVPPRGVWGRSSQVTVSTAEAWLGRPLATKPSLDAVVLRYLAAFGPATVADVTAWCRLAGMRDVIERLRTRLATFRDEAGRELFDLPDAPRPEPSTPAAPRFLPRYDNVLLSHGDRGRFGLDGVRLPWSTDRSDRGTVLDDGVVVATWRLEGARDDRSVIVVAHGVPLSKRAAGSVAAEGRRLARFLAPESAAHEVRLTRVG